MSSRWVWLVLSGMACNNGVVPETPSGPGPSGLPDPPPPPPAVDADMDGFDDTVDCDDANASIYPGAPDTPYDGVDSDCAGDSDFDADGDGFDSADFEGNDCDDTNDQVYPGGTEVCDGADNDCDGTPDSPVPDDAPTWYLDFDDDTYGDPDQSVTQCVAPPDYVALGTDCDDNDGTTYPTAPAVECDGVDNDCDPVTGEPPGPVNIGASQYPTLDDAVAAAQSNDVIEICEGLHQVSGLTIDEGIEIRGTFPADVTRISPLVAESTVYVNTVEPVTLTRVTVTGGNGVQIESRIRGGGLRLADGADVRLVESVVEGNQAEWGAGIYGGIGVSITLTDSAVRNNVARLGVFGGGGGLWVDDDATITMSNSTITGNEADTSCGGMELGANAVVQGNGTTELSSNLADLNGGAICAISGAEIRGVDIIGNEAVSAGGIYGGDIVVSDSLIQGNYGSNSNGGVLLLPGTSSFLRTTFDGNRGEVDVGAMEVNGGAVSLVECTVINNGVNSILGDTGGVQLFDSSLVSTNTDWGTGANDNVPHDIVILVPTSLDQFFNYEGVASFTCDSILNECNTL